MLNNTQFTEETPGARLQLLQDNCHSREESKLKRFFTEDEIAALREKITTHALRMSDIDEEIKAVSEPLKNSLKQVKADQRVCLTEVRRGFEELPTTLYAFDDQEDGMMGYYDEDGKLVSTRKLYPHERQTRIVPMNYEAKGGGL